MIRQAKCNVCDRKHRLKIVLIVLHRKFRSKLKISIHYDAIPSTEIVFNIYSNWNANAAWGNRSCSSAQRIACGIHSNTIHQFIKLFYVFRMVGDSIMSIKSCELPRFMRYIIFVYTHKPDKKLKFTGFLLNFYPVSCLLNSMSNGILFMIPENYEILLHWSKVKRTKCCN